MRQQQQQHAVAADDSLSDEGAAYPRQPGNLSREAAQRLDRAASQTDDEYVPSDGAVDESDDSYAPSDGLLDQSEETAVSSGAARSSPAVARGQKRKRAPKASRPSGEAASKKRRRRDDGDAAAFAARIRAWRTERREQRLLRIEQGVDDEEEEERCVEFEGGFRCPAALWDRLFKYQQVGVRWLWELHQQKCGGILGDEMGLGKTVQVVTFLAGLSRSRVRWGGERGLGAVLIMAPATVLHQWVQEFHTWWPPLRVAVLHESGSHSGQPSQGK
ncbi:DNA excision repair protein ERCC-6-like [Pollicipes pollicipes]|uniref:DNA excision repair protein ERCC-6-like n=1 Tax=Pollicipes pollicipes TaxID=41117 RepID=UPI0018853857|nr:DNA excision repair protein ERCC-6-like [Pollicipes pollicipes]